MNLDTFKAAVKSQAKPTGISIYLETLWYAATDNWEKAHELIQDVPGKDAALLHAYLHRVEGDQWNAEYWYQKAGKKSPDYSLEQEWEVLVKQYSINT